jgi:hypothetical protein
MDWSKLAKPVQLEAGPMRVYEVQPGDSAAGIAARAEHAGCPKCAIDLVRANPHKPAMRYPNGFFTFQSLQPGERLWLPDKWFNGELDSMPQSYFAALPSANGVTPGALGDVSAQDVVDVFGLARLLAITLGSTPDYCSVVADAGTGPSDIVHAFKITWNRVYPDRTTLVDNNVYDQPTATAVRFLLTTAPAACGPSGSLSQAPSAQAEPDSKHLSTAAVVGISAAAAVTIGGAVFLATRPAQRGRRGRRGARRRR